MRQDGRRRALYRAERRGLKASGNWAGYVHKVGESLERLCFERRILGWPAHTALHRKIFLQVHPPCWAMARVVWGVAGIRPSLELVAGFRAVCVVLVFQPRNVKAIGSWRLPHRFQRKAWGSRLHMTRCESLKTAPRKDDV